MLGGNLPAGSDQRRRGGENDLRALFHGFLHGGYGFFLSLYPMDGLHSHGVAEHGFHILPSQVVRTGPVALFWKVVAEKGNIQMCGKLGLEEPGQQIGFRGRELLRFCGNGDFLIDGFHISPDAAEGF